jgi:hypothetical protein
MRALTMCGAAAVIMVSATPAMAQGTWCAEAYGAGAYRNCGYYSFQQCVAGASGVGGFCYPSPWASTAAAEPRKPTKRSKRYR